MGVGIGGMIQQLMQGDPSQQIGQALAGPNPNPMAGVPQQAQGQTQAPSGSPAPPQQLPPAQAYAPDPANASTIAMLLRVHQGDMASADLNRNIQMMSSGFGTAQQQHDKSQLINGAGQGGGDTLGALGEIQKLQMGQMDIADRQRFQASADMLGQQVLGLKPGQGGLLSSDPKLFEMVAQHKLSAQDPTEAMKNLDAWKKDARASGMSEQEIQSTSTMLLGGMVGGGTTDVKNMNHDIMAWKAQNPGKTDAQMLLEHPEYRSEAAYKGAQEDVGKQAQAAGQEKGAAITGLAEFEAHNKKINDNIENMIGPDGHVKQSVIEAVQSMDPPEGNLSSLAGAAGRMGLGSIPGLGALAPDVMDQKVNLAKLRNQLSADGLAGVKNVRNKAEFMAIGGAASGLFDKKNSAANIDTAVLQLKDQTGLAHANALAAAGHEVPAEYADRVNPDYLEGGNRYQGATIAKGGKPMAADDIEQAKSLIAQGHSRESVIAHIKAKGFTPPPGL